MSQLTDGAPLVWSRVVLAPAYGVSSCPPPMRLDGQAAGRHRLSARRAWRLLNQFPNLSAAITRV